jgi:hypothetical protein
LPIGSRANKHYHRMFITTSSTLITCGFNPSMKKVVDNKNTITIDGELLMSRNFRISKIQSKFSK